MDKVRRARPAALPIPPLASVLMVCLLAATSSAAPVAAEAQVGTVTAELTVDGKTIAITTGRAFSTTMGGDDPAIFVRLTEKPAGSKMKDEGAVMQGNAGAMIGIHVQKSGKIYQAMFIHPAADAHFPSDLDKSSVKISGLKIENGKISCTLSTDREVKADGHKVSLRAEVMLPIEAPEGS